MRVRLWVKKMKRFNYDFNRENQANEKKQSEDGSISSRQEIWAHSNVIFYSLVSLFPPKHNFFFSDWEFLELIYVVFV